MNEHDTLSRFGLHPDEGDLPSIRELLDEQAQAESNGQGLGDTEVMKLCCVQLFSYGRLEDVLRIWTAKQASMDASASIDVQLLCGSGLATTKEYLAGLGEGPALEALRYLCRCETAGDFEGFTVADHMAFYRDYYDVGE